ncbi:hypothetical protein Q7P37_009299 [Cladosporium fusiforme]
MTEEVNGRQASEAPSSSSSDLYTAHATPPKEAQGPKDTQLNPMNGHVVPQKPAQPPVVFEDDGDLSSEMDVSDASSSTVSADQDAPGPSHAGEKRKLSDTDPHAANALAGASEPSKKVKLSFPPAYTGATLPVTAGWPPELWQQVFIQLSPAMLSRCLRVCKSFNFYLTQLKATNPTGKKGNTKARVQDSESVWTHSRKTAYPTMPRPLLDFSELRMLQLIGGTTCQSCGRPHVKPAATNVFNAGPGETGVRVIWPFRLRLCGTCFTNESLNDIQILTTKNQAASLIRGLPHAFRTPDGHFVPDHIRQGPNGMPGYLRIQKTFHRKDVDSITAELDEVNSFGDGAADEWRKGLTQRGKDAMADPSRWERWEGTLTLGTMLADVLREYDLASFPQYAEQQQRQQRQTASHYTPVNGALPAPPFHGAHPLPQPVHVFPNTQPSQQSGRPSSGQSPSSAYRPTRNAHEVEAARLARRTDIERRCLELDPPLQPNALHHIKAFKDTMQITTPLTEVQWESMLKPKIMEEREAAELHEHQRAQQLAALQAAIPSALSEEAFTRPAKEVYDREYEQSQEPFRLKLGEYATDRINGRWLQGRSLDRDSCPLFAVDVLLHVRDRYKADKDAGILSSVLEVAPKFNGSKQSTPPMEPFLSLDNMKWVFDNKVRSYTDPLRRELFICAGCAEDRKPKWFAFEGLVQHYGAKHTSAFSKGNVVVHWQTADWPDEPPFFENPAAFIKAERKYPAASKAHGRNKSTPQASIDGPMNSPSTGSMLSDNPLFSAFAAPASGHNGSYPPAYPPANYHYQQPAAEPRADLNQAAHVAKISADAREIWDQLEGIQDLEKTLECVRMQTVVYHTVMRFVECFGLVPTLDLLTDALATNDLMRPIKTPHTLVCKQCTAEETSGSATQTSYFERIYKMKLHNISSLVTHFKIQHQPHGTFEWEKDLIEVPESQIVSELIRKPGMDDNKLALIDAAFPGAFPSPLPHIGVVKEPLPDPGPDTGLASRLVKKLTKGQQQSKKKKKNQAMAHGRHGSSEPGADSREDEYDPRRPMFAEKKKTGFDPSRFDTDLTRKSEEKSEAQSSNTPDNFNLAPETLAALSSLQAYSTGAVAAPDRSARSPSVGRSDSRTVSGQAMPSQSLPQAVPDIAAILASLTGQAQGSTASATPPSISNHGSSRTSHQQQYDPYAQSTQYAPPANNRAKSHRASSRYVSGGSHHSSVEPAPARYDGQDLQAALNRNAQHHSRNAYVEPEHAPVHVAPAPAQRSPPRYRIIYEDEHHYPPQQHHRQPYDGQPAPIQYVPIAEAPTAYRYQHHHAPPPPKPIYVDEYGRPVELIPIDAAPAPIQYMPHPYEQQQQQQYARYADAPQYPAPPPQAVYYEHHQHRQQQPPPAHQGPRYVYDDDEDSRGSVPRA